MTVWICATCGVEHPDTENPPSTTCAICADERQYVPETGQSWTTPNELATDGHELLHEQLEPCLHRLGREPSFGIPHWTHLVRTPEGNLLWDPPNHIDQPLVDRVTELGGVSVVVASHPHMYCSQVSWSHRFGDVPVLVHSADREWVRREDPVIREWEATERILPGVTLVEVGGHFPGSAVAHVADGAEGSGLLLTGDTIAGVAARGWVTFMRSYPNRIPLSPGLVERVVRRLEPYEFDHLRGLAGDAVLGGAKEAVRRSARRHVAWTGGEYDHLG